MMYRPSPTSLTPPRLTAETRRLGYCSALVRLADEASADLALSVDEREAWEQLSLRARPLLGRPR